MNKLGAYDLEHIKKEYYPLIVSINYSDPSDGQQYCYIYYGVFEKDSEQNLKGIRIDKQVAIINGMPFECKTIYGMQQDIEVEEGEPEPEEEDEDAKLCKICLYEEKNTILMPCGHACVCHDCGQSLKEKSPLCPMCRQHIATLIPYDRNRV